MSVIGSNIIAGASGVVVDTGYQIERSLRFNSADSAYLSWTPPQAGNRRTFTISAWVKRAALGSAQRVVSCTNSANGQLLLSFTSGDVINFQFFNGTVKTGELTTSAVFRDASAWYHLVLAIDTTQATSSNRAKLYVNGTQVTAFSTATYMAQNEQSSFNNTVQHTISSFTGSSEYFNGYITEVNFIDGQALTPSDFGETSSSTGVWTPKAYTGSYGNNGFYLPFNDNSTVLNLGRNRQTLTADPYWPYTTLLLNGNGTNGAQNNTFLDSSSNNFTITRNGNVTQGTFSPFSQAGWSALFNGANGSGINLSSNPIAATGQFNFECWVYTNSLSAQQIIFSQYLNTDSLRWQISLDTNGKITMGGNSLPVLSSQTSLQIGRWYHVAISRDGSNVGRIFIDGVLETTLTGWSTTLYTGSPRISGFVNPSELCFNGYLSNMRIMSTAFYTASFSVPTSALTAIANTTLLALVDNRFIDSNTQIAAKTLTLINSTPSIQPFSPFTPTAAYSAATNGGSGYFDGTGDSLAFPTSQASLLPGSGAFTYEVWFYQTVATSNSPLVSYGTGTGNLRFFVANSTSVTLWNGATNLVNQSVTNNLNSWNHIVVQRDGSNVVSIYYNGTRIYTGTVSSNFNAGTLSLGVDGAVFWSGYLSGFKATIGSAAYSGTSITVPTAPPSPTGSTACLNFTNAGIIDATGDNVLETVGNAQISTTQSKWGGSSMYFDGTGDRLLGPTSAATQFSGDFTVECWINIPALPGASVGAVIFASQTTHTNSTGIMFGPYSNGGAIGVFTNNAWTSLSSNPITANTWWHVALVRLGSTISVYTNGVLTGSLTNSTNFSDGGLIIGDGRSFGNAFTGYIDDLRISKFARYTGNFTVPQAQFAYNQADINVKQWVPTNLSVTAGVGNDSLVDSPTNYGTDTGAGGEVRGNYATWNPLKNQATLADGNLSATNSSTTQWYGTTGTIGLQSGKWYWECTPTTAATAMIGLATGSYSTGGHPGWDANSWAYYSANGQKFTNNAGSAYGASYTTNDVIGVAFDADAGTLTFYKNGVSQGTAYTGLTTGPYFPAVGVVNSQNIYLNAGQRPFANTAPSGFKALCATNLPTPAIGASASTLANKYFDTNIYTGNGTSSNTISSANLQPDFLWVKNRSAAASHILVDAVRGINNVLVSSATNADQNLPAYITSLTSNGFTVGTSATDLNANTNSYVYWAWNAGGSTVTNTNGTISSQVRANAAAGISVVTYTGNGVSNATVGHGLGIAPKLMITKNRGVATDWPVQLYVGSTWSVAFLNTTAAATTETVAAPTSSVFYRGTSNLVNASGNTYVAYCFAEVAGFSKFGSYTGNGSADGPFVYCGFRPRWILIKQSSAAGANWIMIDTSRSSVNVADNKLASNLSDAENSATIGGAGLNSIDILSNGFKARTTTGSTNTSGATYIFAAFAEAPFNYARAR